MDNGHTLEMNDEIRRRIKLAQAYANLSNAQLAAKLGMSEATLNRRLRGKGLGTRYQFRAFLEEVADHTGAEATFFTAAAVPGFRAQPHIETDQPPTSTDRDERKNDEEGQQRRVG